LILLTCFVSNSIMAQKVNLDTLNIDQIKVYKDKAVKLRNAGMILTFSGVGIVAAGYIASAIWSSSNSLEGWEALGSPLLKPTNSPMTHGLCQISFVL